MQYRYGGGLAKLCDSFLFESVSYFLQINKFKQKKKHLIYIRNRKVLNLKSAVTWQIRVNGPWMY